MTWRLFCILAGLQYLFLKTHNNSSITDRTQLVSPQYQLPIVHYHKNCRISFTYFLEGSNSTSLEFYLHRENESRLLLWKKHGPGEQSWLTARVDIVIHSLTYKVCTLCCCEVHVQPCLHFSLEFRQMGMLLSS